MNSLYKKNILSTLFTQYGNTVVGFVNSIFVTRILSDLGRGEYALYSNFVSLAVLLFGFSLSTGVVYFVSSKSISANRIQSIAFVYFVVTSLFLFLLITALDKMGQGNLILLEKNQNILGYALCVSSFLLTSLITIMTAIYNGLKRIHIVNKVLVFFTVLNFLTVLVLYISQYYINRNTFLLIVAIQLLVQLGQLLFLVDHLRHLLSREKLVVKDRALKADFKLLFRFSTLIYFTNLLSFFTYKMDYWIINYYEGTSQLGIYSLAVTLAQLLWLMPNSIAMVNLSEVSFLDRKSSSRLTLASYKISLYLTIVSAIIFIPAAYLLIPLVYGEVFSLVPYYIVLLLIGIVPFAPTAIVSSYLAATNNYRHNFYASLLGFLLCVVLDFSLIPYFGVVGACLASSLSYLFIWGYISIYFKKLTGVRYKDLFILDKKFIGEVRLKLITK